MDDRQALPSLIAPHATGVLDAHRQDSVLGYPPVLPSKDDVNESCYRAKASGNHSSRMARRTNMGTTATRKNTANAEA